MRSALRDLTGCFSDVFSFCIDCNLTPLISEEQLNKVVDQLDAGKAAGAEALVGAAFPSKVWVRCRSKLPGPCASRTLGGHRFQRCAHGVGDAHGLLGLAGEHHNRCINGYGYLIVLVQLMMHHK